MAIEANAGARVGDYVLVRKIGEGGMAEVWLARHHATADLRALKFLNNQYQGIPEVEARFQSEGESKLIHPNIVRIFEVGQQAGSSFIAMEFVDGHDLENILNSRRGPLTVDESVDIGTQILAGLGFAHASGIVHRDIKPSNVLVDRDGRAYVMDFGIAKVLRTGRMLTQVNSRLGTPDYMSPEQIRNPRDVDTRSDIYSFGCLFYELLTGWPPFDRGEGFETEHDIKTAHVTKPPTPPIQRKVGLPPQLNEITLRCLAKAKEDRPQSCDEVISAFHAYRMTLSQAQVPIRAGTIVEPPPRPSPIGGATNTPSVAHRETAILPPSDKGAAGHAGRSPTVVDSTPLSHRLIEPVVSGNAGQTPQGRPPKQSDPGGLMPMFLVAAGSLFLLVAAFGGGWIWYHHQHQDTAAQQQANTGESNDASDANRPSANQPSTNQPSTNQGTATTDLNSDHPSGAGQQPGQQPEPTIENARPAQADQSSPAYKVPPDFSPKPNPAPRTIDKPEIPKSRSAAGTPAFGTLVWSGDAATVGKHVTIIRSSRSALEGGAVHGTMFPAGPIHIHVRPPATVTIVPPDARTNYNSLQLFLSDSGQQTIYLDWTAIPN